MTTETYSPDDFILGPDLVVTTVGHFQGGINVPRLTPVMVDATAGTFKVWDGSVGKAVGLTATAINTGSSTADCSYYKSGSFRYTAINWGTVTDVAKRKSAFAGTPISVG
ncbi:TPA: head decoration protein [Escherichia coli]|uniref:head decoration protein n=1 Tax=Escherichia coli TaxID=562 RepID=UPI00107A8686|nr:head decoration protein [Escherichia coli]EAC1376998.1 head decoration protein [Escherichia coli]EKM0487839.1 head decoration protein [Escherichia coli]HEC3533438.1 head decoration protein [Escherichia coli]HEI2758792.1 head decoration protein [Escherichia coli]